MVLKAEHLIKGISNRLKAFECGDAEGWIRSMGSSNVKKKNYFRSAVTLVWNAMETTYKNYVIVYLMCSINYEIKISKFFI